ncbi:hypothetical protein BKA93DRAFT_782803 [Sparassis latifolia]
MEKIRTLDFCKSEHGFEHEFLVATVVDVTAPDGSLSIGFILVNGILGTAVIDIFSMAKNLNTLFQFTSHAGPVVICVSGSSENDCNLLATLVEAYIETHAHCLHYCLPQFSCYWFTGVVYKLLTNTVIEFSSGEGLKVVSVPGNIELQVIADTVSWAKGRNGHGSIISCKVISFTVI